MGRPRKLPEGIRLRNGMYCTDFYAGGRRVRKKLSSDLAAAKEILNEMRSRADKADWGLLDNDFAVADLKEQYLRHIKRTLKASTVDRYVVCLENIVPRLAAIRVSQILEQSVLTYREERLEEGATPRTVNMEVSVLGGMIRWGVSKCLIGSSPLAKLAPLRHDHPKEGRALSDGEVARLLEASPQPWRDVWYAFLVTGLRKAELAGLTFQDIDWEGRELIVRSAAAKNHRERRIPIDTGLWEIVCRQRDERAARRPGVGQTPARTAQILERFSKEHVFVSKANTPLDHRSNLYHAFLRCCEAGNVQTKTCDTDGHVIEHVDVHSLRRTFATNMITNGGDPESLRQLLGHRTLEMTMKIYTKIHNQTKRIAITKLSYGQGRTLASSHVLSYSKPDEFSVQVSHQMDTSDEKKKAN